VFAGVPDFTAELLTSAGADNDVEIGEWRWHGTHTDGKLFEMLAAFRREVGVTPAEYFRPT
jgi:hypothetical protein